MGNNRHLIVPICGFARAGKDSLANAIFDHLEESESEYSVAVMKFADALKSDLEKSLATVGVKADVWTEETEKKAIIRPLLVAYGEYRRSLDPDVWVNKVIDVITDWTTTTVPEAGGDNSVILIPDLRYANEYEKLEALCLARGHTFVPIYIERTPSQPANDAEAASIGLMAAKGYFKRGHAMQLSFPTEGTKSIDQWGKRFTQSISLYHP